MSLAINSEGNSLFSKLMDAADSYKSKLINTDTSDFADYLKDNFSKIDSDGNNLLSANEITSSVKDNKENPDVLNPEIQKILDNKNIESMMANIDVNSDNNIAYKEVDSKSKLTDIMESAFKDFSGSKNLGDTVRNMTQKLGQAYYLNDSAKSMLASAVNYVL